MVSLKYIMQLQSYNLLIRLLIRSVSFSDLYVQLDQNNFLYYVKKGFSTPISIVRFILGSNYSTFKINLVVTAIIVNELINDLINIITGSPCWNRQHHGKSYTLQKFLYHWICSKFFALLFLNSLEAKNTIESAHFGTQLNI